LVDKIRARWIWTRGSRFFIYGKLDPVKVAWIIREKERHQLTTRTIAERMGVSSVWVKKLWRRYRVNGRIPELKKPGRRCIEATDEEKKLIYDAYTKYEVNALTLEHVIEFEYGRHIPHNRIHRVMKSMGIARDEPRKRVRKKWIRYERKYSNSLWHTDWKLIDGYGWIIAYLDDASRFIVGYALFKEPTSEHAVEVLDRAIREHGRPAAILTDRGSQFYAVECDEKLKGLTAFEKYLIEHEIKQILSRAQHPQTNGKIERFFRTVDEKIQRFKSIDELIRWYNMKRPHMSLNLKMIETPYQAYIRKMPKDGIITDEESGETYHAQKI
jgi:putative transposase